MASKVVEKSNYRMHTSFSSNQDDERNTSIGLNRSFLNDSSGIDYFTKKNLYNWEPNIIKLIFLNR